MKRACPKPAPRATNEYVPGTILNVAGSAVAGSVSAIGVLSLLATNYLADGLDQSGLTRLAASASKAREPAITGSINKVKLDPCATPRNP